MTHFTFTPSVASSCGRRHFANIGRRYRLTAARMFEPGWEDHSRGAAIGLPEARGIVEAHGGRVHVVSAPGQGTSLILELPAEEEAEAHGGSRDTQRTAALAA